MHVIVQHMWSAGGAAAERHKCDHVLLGIDVHEGAGPVCAHTVRRLCNWTRQRHRHHLLGMRTQRLR